MAFRAACSGILNKNNTLNPTIPWRDAQASRRLSTPENSTITRPRIASRRGNINQVPIVDVIIIVSKLVLDALLFWPARHTRR